MRTCACVHTHTQTHSYRHTQTYTNMHMCTTHTTHTTHTHPHPSTDTQTHTHTDTHKHIHTHPHPQTHKHIHTQTHTTHKHIHTPTPTPTPRHPQTHTHTNTWFTSMTRLVTKQKPNFQPSECQTCWLHICHTSGLFIQLLLTPHTHARAHACVPCTTGHSRPTVSKQLLCQWPTTLDTAGVVDPQSPLSNLAQMKQCRRSGSCQNQSPWDHLVKLKQTVYMCGCTAKCKAVTVKWPGESGSQVYGCIAPLQTGLTELLWPCQL